MIVELTEDQQITLLTVLLKKYDKDTLIKWLISCHIDNLDIMLEELTKNN